MYKWRIELEKIKIAREQEKKKSQEFLVIAFIIGPSMFLVGLLIGYIISL